MSKSNTGANTPTDPCPYPWEVPATGIGFPLDEFKDSTYTGLWNTLTKQWQMLGGGDCWRDPHHIALPPHCEERLVGWRRAGTLAKELWDCDVVLTGYDTVMKPSPSEPDFSKLPGKMVPKADVRNYCNSIAESTFYRRLLSCICIMENMDSTNIDYGDSITWNNPTDDGGWRPRHIIYTQDIKTGGGNQHKPKATKHGCYMIRLYYMGCWRAIFVDDWIPVDCDGKPLIPFGTQHRSYPSQLLDDTDNTDDFSVPIVLWPALICKALLKLCGPSFMDDCSLAGEGVDPELLDISIFQAFTGWLTHRIDVKKYGLSADEVWDEIWKETEHYDWSAKPAISPTPKGDRRQPPTSAKRAIQHHNTRCSVFLEVADTHHPDAEAIPNISPSHSHIFHVSMTRDVPLDKPPPEPELAPWKHYRWLDWAKRNGMWDAYAMKPQRMLRTASLMWGSYDALRAAPRPSPPLDKTATVSSLEPTVSNGTRVGTSSKKLDVKETINPFPQQASNTSIDDNFKWVDFNMVFDHMKHLWLSYVPSGFPFRLKITNSPLTETASEAKGKSKGGQPSRSERIWQHRVLKARNDALYFFVDDSKVNTCLLSFGHISENMIEYCKNKPTLLRPAPLKKHNRSSSDADLAQAAKGSSWTEATRKRSNPNRQRASLLIMKYDWHSPILDSWEPFVFIKTDCMQTVRLQFQPGRYYLRMWINTPTSYVLQMISNSPISMSSRYTSRQLAAAPSEAALALATRVADGASRMWTLAPPSKPQLQPIVFYNERRAFFSAYKPDLPWDPNEMGFEPKAVHMMMQAALQDILKNQLSELEYAAVCRLLRKFFLNPHFGMEPGDPQYSFYWKVILDNGYREEFNEKRMSLFGAPEDAASQKGDSSPVPAGVTAATVRLQSIARRLTVMHLFDWSEKFDMHNIQKIITPILFDKNGAKKLLENLVRLYPRLSSAYSWSQDMRGEMAVDDMHGFVQAPTTNSSSDGWYPLVMGVMCCHDTDVIALPDIYCNIDLYKIVVYDLDSMTKVRHLVHSTAVNSYSRNERGYYVAAYGWVPDKFNKDIQWRLQLIKEQSRTAKLHFCDNMQVSCTPATLVTANKLSISDSYRPNKTSLIMSVFINVNTTSPLILRFWTSDASVEFDLEIRDCQRDMVVSTISGTGCVVWECVYLQGPVDEPDDEGSNTSVAKQSSFPKPPDSVVKGGSFQSLKLRKGSTKQPKGASLKAKSAQIFRQYQFIAKINPYSQWPLTKAQWTKIEELRNPLPSREKVSQNASARSKKVKAIPRETLKVAAASADDDTLGLLEVGCMPSAQVTLDLDRRTEESFKAEVVEWEEVEPGRGARGALLRKEFRLSRQPSPEDLQNETKSVINSSSGDVTEKSVRGSQLSQRQPTTMSRASTAVLDDDEDDGFPTLVPPKRLEDILKPLEFLNDCKPPELPDSDKIIVTKDVMQEIVDTTTDMVLDYNRQYEEDKRRHEVHHVQRQVRRIELMGNLIRGFGSAGLGLVTEAFLELNEHKKTLKESPKSTPKTESKTSKGSKKATLNKKK